MIRRGDVGRDGNFDTEVELRQYEVEGCVFVLVVAGRDVVVVVCYASIGMTCEQCSVWRTCVTPIRGVVLRAVLTIGFCIMFVTVSSHMTSCEQPTFSDSFIATALNC